MTDRFWDCLGRHASKNATRNEFYKHFRQADHLFLTTDSQFLFKSQLKLDSSDPTAVKPRILKDSYQDSEKLKRGQTITLTVKFLGEPMPNARWEKGGKVRQLSPGFLNHCFSSNTGTDHLHMAQTFTFDKCVRKHVCDDGIS